MAEPATECSTVFPVRLRRWRWWAPPTSASPPWCSCCPAGCPRCRTTPSPPAASRWATSMWRGGAIRSQVRSAGERCVAGLGGPEQTGCIQRHRLPAAFGRPTCCIVTLPGRPPGSVPHACPCRCSCPPAPAADTPGLLNRAEEDRNAMERLTLACLQHLPTAVLFVADLTGECGTSVANQWQIRWACVGGGLDWRCLDLSLVMRGAACRSLLAWHHSAHWPRVSMGVCRPLCCCCLQSTRCHNCMPSNTSSCTPTRLPDCPLRLPHHPCCCPAGMS